MAPEALSAAEVEDVRARFARVDIDKDGLVDAADFAQLCRRLCPDAPADALAAAVRGRAPPGTKASADDMVAAVASLRGRAPPVPAGGQSAGQPGAAKAAYLAAVRASNGAQPNRSTDVGSGKQPKTRSASQKPGSTAAASAGPQTPRADSAISATQKPSTSTVGGLGTASNSATRKPSDGAVGGLGKSEPAKAAPGAVDERQGSRRGSISVGGTTSAADGGETGPSVPTGAAERTRGGRVTRIAGATESSQHSVDDDEIAQYALHIDSVLGGDADVAAHVPITGGDGGLHASFFRALRDGVVVSKLVNAAVPETVDERVLHVPSGRLNAFQMTENNNVAINSARALGCSVVNIGAQDLIEGREHLVLGIVWQVIKRGLLARVSLQAHPELYRLLGPGENLAQLLALPADALLLRWANFHLAAAGFPRRLANFGADVRDSEAYAALLRVLGARGVPDVAAMDSLEARAEAVLQGADALGCRRYASVRAIVSGNPRLNLAFVAHLFNTHPCLAPLSTAERAQVDEGLFAAVGDREARALALWMNSLGADPPVVSLYDDLRDGRVLLSVLDAVCPGAVPWGRVHVGAPLDRFRALENTNAVVALCARPPLSLSLGCTQGADITDGARTLTLGLAWQLMRAHVVRTLAALGGGRPPSDDDVLAWANGMVPAGARVSSLRDPELASGVFLLELADALRPGTVDRALVLGEESGDPAWRTQNAKYAISVARRLGAAIFVLPEDVVDVRPRLVFTLVASLMAVHARMSSEQ